MWEFVLLYIVYFIQVSKIKMHLISGERIRLYDLIRFVRDHIRTYVRYFMIIQDLWKLYMILYDFVRLPQSHHFRWNRTVRFLYDLNITPCRSYKIHVRFSRASDNVIYLIFSSLGSITFFPKKCFILNSHKRIKSQLFI